VSQDAVGSMHMKLSEERRAILINAVQRLFLDEFERDLSEFQASRLIEFFLGQLGPPVYNQGVHDARAHIQLKLEDLDGEVYEPEQPV